MNINKKNNNKNYLYRNIFGLDKGVIELVLDDFKYKNKKLYIQNNYFEEKKGLIIFYAPWCEHCIKMSDSIINLALSNENLFYFGSVNAENIKDGNDYLCYYAKIKKFPTIKYITKEGLLKDYEYEYTTDNLLYYINTNI